ncbi:MAG: TerC/Alx family metal homeostasis membrane protein [Clostridiaceae bacterium]|nr:TerC/Alx family metal homeostasis membrane protein [Clostridiaceae bacterium]
MGTGKAFLRLCYWVGLALIFNIGIYFFMGQQKAAEFLGGYIIEQSLSLDNLFLFLIIFKSFGIGPRFQNRILNYGIIGAIILRLVFIILGVSIINRFYWMLYVFGITLIFSGIKMFNTNEEIMDFKESFLYKALRKVMPVTENLEGEKFFVVKNKRLYATPLFAILVLIEGSDIIFAMDSIPAIFSITRDLFIVYTSNIFAILGLRNMYFLLERLQSNFSLVKYGVALILIFTGVKLSLLFFKFDISVFSSLIVISSILILSIIFSMLVKENEIVR